MAALNLEDASAHDQLAFLSTYGDELFATAISQLVDSLPADEQEALQAFLATDPELETLLYYLIETHPSFTAIVQSVLRDIDVH